MLENNRAPAPAGAWLLSGRMRDYFSHGWSMLAAVLRPLLGAARLPLMKLPGLAVRHAGRHVLVLGCADAASQWRGQHPNGPDSLG